MADVMPGDSLETFQLKECYELAMRFEKLITAKDVLRAKSNKLDIPMNYAPVQTDAVYQETEMQIVSEALYELTLEDFEAYEGAEFRYAHKIDSLPISGEKEFMLALLSLRSGSSETHRLNALRHIQAALSFSHNDPRYIALAHVLQEAGNQRG